METIGVIIFFTVICGAVQLLFGSWLVTLIPVDIGILYMYNSMRNEWAKEEGRRRANAEAAKAKAEAAAEIERRKKCPKCYSFNTIISDTSAHSYKTTETKSRVTRRYNKDDEYIGYEETDVEVPVERTYYVYHRKCNKCNHTWDTERS